MARPRVLLLVGLLAATACDGPYLADDIDIDFNFSLLSGPSDTLHLPYVQGAKVVIYAQDTDDHIDRSSWWLESSDEGVLHIDTQSAGRASCTAVGAGRAEIRVYGYQGARSPFYSSEVTVRQPTSAKVYAHGPMLLARPEETARVDSVKLLTGGLATFLVRYFDGETPLYGNGVLQTTVAPQTLTASTETTFFFENREWLRLKAADPGSYHVELRAAGVLLKTLEITAVTDGDIARIALDGESEDGADERETLTVLAQAYDAADQAIYGMAYRWFLDGVAEPEEGDLFRYKYDAKRTRTLAATYATHRTERVIHASSGYVSSTNFIGCSAAPGGAGDATAPLLGALALGLVALSRRRRAR
jgi:MYXO-CTERM domain-containing protein